jgi:hypothetical protein
MRVSERVSSLTISIVTSYVLGGQSLIPIRIKGFFHSLLRRDQIRSPPNLLFKRCVGFLSRG